MRNGQRQGKRRSPPPLAARKRFSLPRLRLPRLGLPRLSAGKILHTLAKGLVLALILGVGVGLGVLLAFFLAG